MENYGSIDVSCDAPSYAVVRACKRLGFRAPEDVRWYRLNRSLPWPGWNKLLGTGAWQWLFGGGPDRQPACTCGRELPGPEQCTFWLASGKEVNLLLSQCPRCRTIYWNER